ILHGDGSFISETQTGTEFTAKKGERYKTKHPVESELWKKKGQIDRDTVSHQDYTSKTGERYPVSKPQDSDILHGDGSFISETQTGTEFTAEKGERHETKHPAESELWEKPCDTVILYIVDSFRTGTVADRIPGQKRTDLKLLCLAVRTSGRLEQKKQDEFVVETKHKRCSVLCTESLKSAFFVYDTAEHRETCTENWKTTYTETFYEGVPVEDVRRVIQHENRNFKLSESQSIYRISSIMPTISAMQVQMTSTKLKESTFWQNDQMEGRIPDFVLKLKPCPASILINRSIKTSLIDPNNFNSLVSNFHSISA
ncbi:unnamed protein product, partial [Cercopithifilaria johnstoni]